ncbi:tellurite resistance TerB family protein [Streptomyces profundus]|uniref:tellurite resistance TerB family protein n=1 Tax=Streptomyces profundus TaxID=2867410 RepID=UPI001D1648F7|nr:TerB family tellurite resistance protein [Streptomyces sp. MA3_2.13]UED85397.1 TerB family tellurite resistance protein [Streptomyces sp. MA3_2.13]
MSKELHEWLVSKKAAFRGAPYRDASMAMCALVASADGSVHAAERKRVESLIAGHERLKHFPPDQLLRLFNRHIDRLSRDFRCARGGVLREIAKVRDQPELARAVIRTGVVIAGADGHYAHAERQVILEVCELLNVSPTEFGP